MRPMCTALAPVSEAGTTSGSKQAVSWSLKAWAVCASFQKALFLVKD